MNNGQTTFFNCKLGFIVHIHSCLKPITAICQSLDIRERNRTKGHTLNQFSWTNRIQLFQCFLANISSANILLSFYVNFNDIQQPSAYLFSSFLHRNSWIFTDSQHSYIHSYQIFDHKKFTNNRKKNGIFTPI